MKKHTYLLFYSIMAALLLSFSVASAHEHQIFRIGDKYYQFTVGSLNEPVAVDDKTGVDVRVEMVSKEHATEKHDDGDHAAEKATPVSGLEATLKVELKAGEKTRTLALSPTYNTPGSYRANFIPTVQTTYSYRFFGTVNATPVDLTFTCNPAGHPVSEEDRNTVKISDKVDRLSKSGAYGCPAQKAVLGFPEASVALYDANTKIEEVASVARSSRMMGIGGLILAIAGLAAGSGALLKKRNG